MRISNESLISSTEEETQQPVIPTADDLKALIIKAYCDERTACHQYTIAAHIARGTGYCDAVPEYKAHADEEDDHSEGWLKRLEQLGVQLNYDLTEIQNGGNPWTPIKTSNVKEQLEILIKAEDDAAAFYQKIIEAARLANDAITKTLAKQYQADEVEHATDLRRILECNFPA